MSIPRAEKPENKKAQDTFAKKDGSSIPKAKVKKPWSLSQKLVFWPASLFVSFVITVVYTFLVMHICYSVAGAGRYLIDNKFVILAASAGLFVILFLLECLVRGGNRHLRVEEFCVSVYLVPAIAYGVAALIFHGRFDDAMKNMIDNMDNNDALGYYYFLLMFYYILIALLIRGFFNFLGLMRDFSKAKRVSAGQKK